jgi:hypothetical protein
MIKKKRRLLLKFLFFTIYILIRCHGTYDLNEKKSALDFENKINGELFIMNHELLENNLKNI